MGKKIVFVSHIGGRWGISMFGDESNFDETWQIEEFWKPTGKVISKLRKVIFSRKVNRFLSLRNSFIAKQLLKGSILFGFAEREREVMVLSSGTAMKEGNVLTSNHALELLKDLIEKKRVALYLTDNIPMFVNFKSEVVDLLNTFDKVFTYSKKDSDEFGYPLLSFPYVEDKSQHFAERVSKTPSRDFSLLQSLPKEKIRRIFTDRLLIVAEEANLTYYFKTDPVPEYQDMINYVSKGFYGDFEARIGDVNCVVNLTGFDGEYISNKVYEAFYYGRKMLTNCHLVKDLECYDERFVKAVSSPDEISPELVEWMKKREDVHYENLECFGIDRFKARLLELV